MIETFEAKPCDDMIELSQIERMSVTERLRAMDQLWDSLSRHGDEIPSPDWHQDVLADRKARAQRRRKVSHSGPTQIPSMKL
jgi:putative addiction module component